MAFGGRKAAQDELAPIELEHQQAHPEANGAFPRDTKDLFVRASALDTCGKLGQSSDEPGINRAIPHHWGLDCPRIVRTQQTTSFRTHMGP